LRGREVETWKPPPSVDRECLRMQTVGMLLLSVDKPAWWQRAPTASRMVS
jgi:hypothetical protein